MRSVAVFKTKSFGRWAASSELNDEELCNAALEIAKGIVEARLGGGVFKKRVALANRGKSAGARTLVAFKEGSHTFYLYGFKKNERSNISDKELRALKSAAGVWFSLSQSDLDSAIEAGILIELECEE